MTSKVNALYLCMSTQKFQNMADLHGQMAMNWKLIFLNSICWIQLCDIKNLTFVDCCDKIFIKLVLKNVINPFPNNKILDWSNFEAFTEDRINVIEILNFVLGKIANTVGNGENAGYQHFLVVPQCFRLTAFYKTRLIKCYFNI